MSLVNRGPQKMLLCIDDSLAILEYEKRMLEESGFMVVTTASPSRGLRLAALFPFDAVLLDYQMPEMNGHQLACEIRRLRPETSVVMFSGGDIPEETRELVDAVVPKSNAHRDLLPTVTRLCDRGSAT